MRILHYFLGFPPYRTGGLTNFAYDLMKSQKENGDDVSAVWPGAMHVINKRVRIVKKNSVNGINNYEIINPLPVPLDEGIKNPALFTASVDGRIYYEFLKKINPDAIHFHTLMGLHKEFVKAANVLKIKTVFTSHDYFGICPKVTLFKNGNVCDDDNNCTSCVKCNESALSIKKIILLQSSAYRCLKESSVVKALRKKHRSAFLKSSENVSDEQQFDDQLNGQRFIELRDFYIGILSEFSLIHFNSTLAEKIYKRYFTPKKSIVLSISNREINDNHLCKKTESDKIRYTYLASNKCYKGYYLLKNAFDKLWKTGKKNFQLNVYCDVEPSNEYMIVHKEGFTRSQLNDIFSETDYLIAPSVWYETYGFTVLEALSHGIPVIVSENVGAKDIINGHGYIIEAGNSDALYKLISDKSLEQSDKNFKIDNNLFWDNYVALNYNLYK